MNEGDICISRDRPHGGAAAIVWRRPVFASIACLLSAGAVSGREYQPAPAAVPNKSVALHSERPHSHTYPEEDIVLGSSSRALNDRAMRLGREHPCAAVALLQIPPKGVDLPDVKRTVLHGAPTLQTVKAVLERKSPEWIDRTLAPIWAGLYATGGRWYLSIAAVTREAGADRYEMTVYCEIVDSAGVPIPDLPLFEPAVRFSWTRSAYRLLGINTSEAG
jgi:hypothetical protein